MLNMPMNQEQLRLWIDQVSLALVDTLLFLDTHPYDEDALDYYKHHAAMKKKAVKMYEEQYGPLTARSAPTKDYWDWVMQPWPWEGGCK